MKTEDFLRLTLSDIEKMTEKELRTAVSTMRSTARKRYERLQDKGLENVVRSHFKRGAPGEDPLPTVKGMDEITLRNEYTRYKRFLSADTTVKKVAAKAKQQTDYMEEFTGKKMTEKQKDRFFTLYDATKNSAYSNVLHYRERAQIVADVMKSKEYKRKANSTMLKEIENRMRLAYEKQYGTDDTLPSFFIE